MSTIPEAPFGVRWEEDPNPKMIDVSEELLTTVTDQANQIIDEIGLRQYIDDNNSIIARYKGGYRGVAFFTCAAEDSYSIHMAQGNRYMSLEYDRERNSVTGISDHNFDENGYQNTMGEWIINTIFRGLENADDQGVLKWEEKKSNGYDYNGKWIEFNNESSIL